MLTGKHEEDSVFVPRGMYRRPDERVLVRYEKNTMLLPKLDYEERGYLPGYEELPTEAEWELQWNANRT